MSTKEKDLIVLIEKQVLSVDLSRDLIPANAIELANAFVDECSGASDDLDRINEKLFHKLRDCRNMLEINSSDIIRQNHESLMLFCFALGMSSKL